MSGIDGRMLDKNAYSTETLNTFSFMSAYFVDLYYNHLYTQAIRFHRNKQVATVTDGYKASLDAFLQSINGFDKELYSELVHGIHQTFMEYGFRGMSYQQCIDKIVKEFIPQDYWKIISFDDKSKILGTIITNSNRAMVHKIISTHLSEIIDNHADQDNANILQDAYIDILIMEREKLYHEFINAKTKGGEGSLVQSMEREIILLSKQKNELRQQLHDSKKEVLTLQKKLLTMCKHGKDTSTQVKSLEAELAKERLLNKDLSQKLEAAIAVEAPGTKATPRGGSYLEEATQSYVTKPSVAMDDLDSAENFANVANDDDSATADDFANAEAEDFAINDSDNEPEEIMFNTQSPATPSYKNISFVDDDDELYSLE
jgi:hypothetical protein